MQKAILATLATFTALTLIVFLMAYRNDQPVKVLNFSIDFHKGPTMIVEFLAKDQVTSTRVEDSTKDYEIIKSPYTATTLEQQKIQLQSVADLITTKCKPDRLSDMPSGLTDQTQASGDFNFIIKCKPGNAHLGPIRVIGIGFEATEASKALEIFSQYHASVLGTYLGQQGRVAYFVALKAT